MRKKRSYFKPTIQIVDMKTCNALLGGSPNGAEREGYTYEENGWE
jgi:hypothetical protein